MNFRKDIIASKRLAIASTLGCAAISLPLFLAACGDDSSSNSSDNGNAEDSMFTLEEIEEMGIDIYESTDKLKKEKCDSENEFEIVYVKADSSFYVCYENKWDNDPNAEIETVESKDKLGKCTEENEGQMFRVPRDTIFDTYACESGEWVSDFGGNSGEFEFVGDPYKEPVKETFKDERDGKTYKSVKIGKLTWMAENLNYATEEGSLCYEFKEENCTKYGRLYTWAAAVGRAEDVCGYNHECDLRAKNVHGVCPEGWHLPSESEWNTFLSTGVEAMALKSYTSDWSNGGGGADMLGFSALPAGANFGYNQFYRSKGNYAFFWSSTPENAAGAFAISIMNDVNKVIRKYYPKIMGMSVRCVKD